MAQHSTPKERVEYGLDTVDADRMVSVKLRDLLHLHQTLGEFARFFHQPLHYRDIESVRRFLGSRDSGGGIGVLLEAYYQRMADMLPADITGAFDAGKRFEHPLPP